MSSVLEKMHRLSAAEEFFTLLEVPYDPAVLNVARLHILRRMGEYLATKSLEAESEEIVRTTCRACLTQAYDEFTTARPVEQRVFRVLQNAVRHRGFVPISDLMNAPIET